MEVPFSTCLLVSIFLVFVIYKYLTRTYGHWKKKGVPYLEPQFFFGNLKPRILLRVSENEFSKRLYQEHAGKRYIGIYSGLTPVLFVRDPDLIKHIMVKDFEYFVDREVRLANTSKYFDNNLLRLKGEMWKSVRTLLTPTFTSKKMKMMSGLVTVCGEQMVNYLQNISHKSEHEMKSFFTRYTLDVIATCAFGVQCDSLKNPEAEFLKIAINFLDSSKMNRLLIFLLTYLRVKRVWGLPVRFLNKKTEEFLDEVLTSTRAYRDQHNVRRDDFFQLLLDSRKGILELDDNEKLQDNFEKDAELQIKESKDELSKAFTDDILMAQAFLFLIAGFDTSSILLTFASYELALHPEIQERLREEVLRVLSKHEGQCTYEAIQEMTYMDMVLSETLRKHPPVAKLGRECTQRYVIPGTNVTLEKGDSVWIPVVGFHYDEKFYPEPHRFDPDRFLPENKAKRHPYAYIPFGGGPRNCIGKRFALMSSKIGLACLLKDHKVVPCRRTEVPIKYDERALLLKSKNGTWLSLEKL